MLGPLCTQLIIVQMLRYNSYELDLCGICMQAIEDVIVCGLQADLLANGYYLSWGQSTSFVDY